VWATLLPVDQTEADDRYDLERWRYTLHKSWSSHFVATLMSGNETEIRNGTDDLFELAFQQRSGWKQRFK
jgi:hypothetical protein